MKSLQDLPESAQHWTTVALNWADTYWDQSAGLLTTPDDIDVDPDAPRANPVRSTVWYALGLLMRRGDGDVERALLALNSILKYQFDEPDAVYHGTFYRSPQESHPPENPKEWRDYDPNWREFICTVFIVIVYEFKELLPDSLQADVMQSIKLAAEGAAARDVDAAYTNISLMSAFLLDYAAKELDHQHWREQAATKAQDIHDLFRKYDAFWEYNSPTYYGVDFIALALWRDYGLSDEIRRLGAEMEADLWRDVARYYQADMRNLCGPYDRSYGMDMTKYIAVLGLSIAAVVPVEFAPLPDPTRVFGHAADFYFMPPIGLLTPVIPEDVMPHFLSFQGQRQVEQTIEAGRTATAWLSDNLMLGAQSGNRNRIPNYQYHPMTAHWRDPSGEIAWIRLRAEAHMDAVVEGRTVTISGDDVSDFYFGVYVNSADSAVIQPGRWSLPGLTVTVSPDNLEPNVVKEGNKLAVRFSLPTSTSGKIATVTFEES